MKKVYKVFVNTKDKILIFLLDKDNKLWYIIICIDIITKIKYKGSK